MEDFIKKISFSKKPISIPADYRPLYKIAQIVTILKLTCRGESANLLKLHLFSWALKSEKNRNELWNYVKSNFQTDFSVWGIEPTLNRALQIAVAEKICTYSNGKYILTLKGNEYYNLFSKDDEILSVEKEFLNRIGKSKITDNRLKQLSNKWTLFNVKN